MRWHGIAVSTALFLVTAAVNLEVPLYRTYAAAAGYGSGLTAIVFAGYIAGLLPVLIFLGGISDRIGRKSTLLMGLSAAALATAVVILDPTMPSLLLARLLQGVGVGLSMGAGTAYLVDLQQGNNHHAAATVAIMTALGFGGGALFTNAVLLVQPHPVPISYWVVFLLTLGCMVWIAQIPSLPAPGGLLLRLPYFPPGTVLPGMAIALSWAVTGFVITVIPAQLARYDLTIWTGLALFLVNGTGALLQPVARQFPPQKAILIGLILLPLGYSLLILGAWLGILGVVLAGAALAGAACYGFIYLGGLAEVSRLGGSQRARAVSGYFLCAYLGFGLPSILIGFMGDRFGIMTALLIAGTFIYLGSTALFTAAILTRL